MPRGSKATHRQKVNAAIEFKKGNRKEAYAMWEKAAVARKERYAKKHNKRKPATEVAGAEAPAEGGA